MLSRIKLIVLFACCSLSVLAQKPQPTVQPAPTPVATPQPVQKPIPFKRLNAAIEYNLIVDKPTSPKPKEGDVIKVHMMSAANGRMLYNSRNVNKGTPVEFSANKPTFTGDIVSAIMLMTPGDSLICQVDADAIFKNTKNKMPDFIKKGDKIVYFIRLVSVKTKEQMQKEQQALFQKQMKEQMAKQAKEQQKLIAVEDKKLQDYFTKNNLTPTKTASGLYYTIRENGEGNNPQTGDTVSMNYTGQLLDGTKFDSNEDTAFHHVQPFEFPLGMGRVIKGWDEGVALLKPNSKATFYIPSRLAYGTNAMPGSTSNPKGIPANSILLFDVALKNIKPQVKPVINNNTNTEINNNTKTETK